MENTQSSLLITHQQFFTAVESDDIQSLKLILHKFEAQDGHGGASIPSLMSLQNSAGETALYIAAQKNLVHIFSFLLNYCQIHIAMIRSKADLSPFHVAAKCGHLEIVQQLLDIWPELCRCCDSSNTSPLYSAAVQGHLEVVDAILQADDTAARIVRKNGKTALHTAARYGLLDMVKLLVERDPGIVSIKDKKGQTALHMAAKGQDPSIIELLLADCSVLNERDKKGNTAVHIATRKSRAQVVCYLLSYTSVEVNAINNQQETAMDLASKLQYGESALEIREALSDAGGKYARNVGKVDENMELKRTVSDIKHEVHSQLIQNEKTNKRVSGIAKELKKLHREAVQNTTNSVTVVAVLFASIAFLAIFNLNGQYVTIGPEAGKANIANTIAFRVFCLLNAVSLFISLAVVVIQITLVAWDTQAQKLVVTVTNKLMWVACLSTCGAFLAIAFVVVGHENSWMAIFVTIMGTFIMMGTLASMCYFVFQHHFRIFGNDSQRRIKRASGSKSFSWSYSINVSDIDEYNSDHERIYAL
ncbi:ankyrin repeat-containing protein At2g01680 [Amaranthus tricolor]|uniref:ankyrin repeat-containing protein At2g01680 n=1 Tax=Amaranthus tricolor TaxID=29722 RepID=UPI00258CE048|nr:ankyrin repeat-containing protein At2g01680 [Amaranthus tricolor]